MRTCPGRPYAPPPSRAGVSGDVTGGVAASSQEAKAILDQGADDEPRAVGRRRGAAAVLLVAAINKLVIPPEKLATFPGGGWVEDFSPGALKAISALEILGAVGLILPASSASRRSWCRGCYRCGVAVHRRGDHPSPPWREGNDPGRPGLSRPGRLRGVGPLRPRVLPRLTIQVG